VSEKEQAMGTMGNMKEKLTGLEDKMSSGQPLVPADIRDVRNTA